MNFLYWLISYYLYSIYFDLIETLSLHFKMSIATVTRYAIERENKKEEIRKLMEGMPESGSAGSRLKPREKSLMRGNAEMILSRNNLAEKYGYNSPSLSHGNKAKDYYDEDMVQGNATL